MSPTLLPFLYQTRTLRRAFAAQPVLALARQAHALRKSRTPKHDNAIPFEWAHEGAQDELGDVPGRQQSTITPSEAEVFKGIFDEIAQGRMPAAKKRPSPADATFQSVAGSPADSPEAHLSGSFGQSNGMARSIVEQARVTEFRDKFLRRYPQSLRNAAQVALGLYELEPGTSGQSQMLELDEADEKKWEERARYDRARVEERERVDALMKSFDTDAALWQAMEKEVFSLPEKLGIVQNAQGKVSRGQRDATTKRKTARNQQSALDADSADSTLTTQQRADEEKRTMDVHGPLYPHFISTGLALCDTAFDRPSPFAFAILPRVKALGLPSYVLGVSTPFYSRLARMHWNRFGDANSALDVLQEMNSAGLYDDDEVSDLVVKIRDHVHGCTWGAQGPFVMAMMESPPYDGALTQRLEEMERYARQSLSERASENAA
ncbi:hypothetical protein TOPH_08194 [Tolypocladium ophioglossoides CBS 100239]|uniref:Mtf2-like C-terminal domain-containing protein n=1 Tax=Tolypocladium ophioglossoides (strain CBS 100239) TaxID=1163406 RepID=A0A0L0MZE0_TOLOC|nr:hypothetical protein TOPH_08194 [Tolypocladium ophioglossoides CBS 100239]